MTFKTQMGNDAENVFLNSNEFAETIVYTPSSGSPVTILAVVTRYQLDPDAQGQAKLLKRQCQIEIQNDSTDGVISVDKGSDQVSIPPLTGQAAVTWRIVEIISKDDGMWKLLCER